MVHVSWICKERRFQCCFSLHDSKTKIKSTNIINKMIVRAKTSTFISPNFADHMTTAKQRRHAQVVGRSDSNSKIIIIEDYNLPSSTHNLFLGCCRDSEEKQGQGNTNIFWSTRTRKKKYVLRGTTIKIGLFNLILILFLILVSFSFCLVLFDVSCVIYLI